MFVGPLHVKYNIILVKWASAGENGTEKSKRKRSGAGNVFWPF